MTMGGARRNTIAWAAFKLDLLPQSVRAFISDAIADRPRTPVVVMGASYVTAPNIDFSPVPDITRTLPTEVAATANDSREITADIIDVLEKDEGFLNEHVAYVYGIQLEKAMLNST